MTPDSVPSFAEVVRDHWVAVFRVLSHMTGDDHDAEELTQETFLRGWQNWSRFEPGTRPRAWLFRIARNAYVDFYRRHQTIRFEGLAEERVVTSDDPTRVVEVNEQATAIRSALLELTELARLVFLLRVEGELSFAEVADELEISEEAARWHMHQARTKLLARMIPKE